MHGDHVDLICTAGLLNGVLEEGENRHIARRLSVKHVTTFVEEDGDAEIIHHRERWTNELRLAYAGEYADVRLHAGLVYIDASFGLNLSLQRQLFALIFDEPVKNGDLTNQLLEVKRRAPKWNYGALPFPRTKTFDSTCAGIFLSIISPRPLASRAFTTSSARSGDL